MRKLLKNEIKDFLFDSLTFEQLRDIEYGITETPPILKDGQKVCIAIKKPVYYIKDKRQHFTGEHFDPSKELILGTDPKK